MPLTSGWAEYLVGFRGWMRLWRGAWEEALDDFRRQKPLTPPDCMLSPLEIGQELWRLCACGEDYGIADDHFAESLRLAEMLPLLPERAEARRWWAWALLRRGGDGDRDRARELLGEAIAVYEELGSLRHAELARSMMP